MMTFHDANQPQPTRILWPLPAEVGMGWKPLTHGRGSDSLDSDFYHFWQKSHDRSTDGTYASIHDASRFRSAGPTSTRALPHARRRQRGAAIIEFALVFIFALSLTLGLMEFGRLIWSYHTLAHATREALRIAMIRGSENPPSGGENLSDTISNAVKSRAIGLDTSKITVTVSWPSGIERGAPVQVQSIYDFGFVTGSFIYSGGGTFQLVSNAQAILLN